MNEEPLIEPIIHVNPGECPLCNGILMVVDCETCCMLLGPDGTPIREETTIRCQGVCQSCKSIFPMIRHGFGYRVYSRSGELFRKYDIQKKRKLSHTKVDGNPFTEKE